MTKRSDEEEEPPRSRGSSVSISGQAARRRAVVRVGWGLGRVTRPGSREWGRAKICTATERRGGEARAI